MAEKDKDKVQENPVEKQELNEEGKQECQEEVKEETPQEPAQQQPNIFVQRLNWKILTIDTIKRIISIAIGMIIGLFTDAYTNSRAEEARYQQIITATLVNLENYADQIEYHLAILGDVEGTLDLMYELDERDELQDSTAIEATASIYYKMPFAQLDRWIEENFIMNGDFIKNTELRLKIGQSYSTIQLCRDELERLKAETDPEYAKFFANWMEDETTCVEKTFEDKAFLNYIRKESQVHALVSDYLAILKTLNDEIKYNKEKPIDEVLYGEVKSYTEKINNIINKPRNVEEE